jgi:hemolysin III
MHRNIFQYSKKEELINTITHFLGIPLSIFILISLVAQSLPTNDVSRVVSNSIFGSALILLFTASTLYHFASTAKLKVIFKRLDHSCIYIFMAASYTPYILHHFDNNWTSVLLSSVWIMALFGVLYKMFARKKNLFLSVSSYLCFGILFFLIKAFVNLEMSDQVFNWLIIGGVFYIVGTLFYTLKKMPHHHGVWHVFVLCGVTSQYISLSYSI